MRDSHTISRVTEYFTESELTRQIGGGNEGKTDWVLFILKELVDNALDAIESESIESPEIVINIGDNSLSVQDNGSGIPFNTIKSSLNYNVRVSSNRFYVSPTRGQLGNGLKVCWAAPFVQNLNEKCTHTVCTREGKMIISLALNQVTGEPLISWEFEESNIKTGTFLKLEWKKIASYFYENESEFFNYFYALAFFNPHVTFQVCTPKNTLNFPPYNPDLKKWKPNSPIPLHWFSFDEFQSLLMASTQEKRDRPIREFLKQFKGLSSDTKMAKVMKGLNKLSSLGDLISGEPPNERPDEATIQKILDRGQKESSPPKIEKLGQLKKDAARDWVKPEPPIKHKSLKHEDENSPFIVEAWFAETNSDRAIEFYGLNFSPLINCPFDYWFKSSMFDVNADVHWGELIEEEDSVFFAVHIVCPRFDFSEHGKGKIILSNPMREKIIEASHSVLKDWAKKKKRKLKDTQKFEEEEERDRVPDKSAKDAIFEVMERAYSHASGNGEFPAHCRQIMYAARPLIQELTSKDFSDDYFRNTLHEFLRENPELTKDWQVCFDPRGSFFEPHSGAKIPLGTLKAQEYIERWHDPYTTFSVTANAVTSTSGANGCYGGALFIEKEGFYEILQASRIAEEFDIAYFSTKGMPTTAARSLIEELGRNQIPIYALHDLDIAGLRIAHCLANDTDVYTFKNKPIVYDFGLRLKDVEELNLGWEEQEFSKEPTDLEEKGATLEEIDFLVQGRRRKRENGKEKIYYWGRRVELNALTAPQFVEFIRRKLTAVGAKKVIPNETVLMEAYRKNLQAIKLDQEIERLKERVEKEATAVDISGSDLTSYIISEIEKNPCLSWVEAVTNVARKNLNRGSI